MSGFWSLAGNINPTMASIACLMCPIVFGDCVRIFLRWLSRQYWNPNGSGTVMAWSTKILRFDNVIPCYSRFFSANKFVLATNLWYSIPLTWSRLSTLRVSLVQMQVTFVKSEQNSKSLKAYISLLRVSFCEKNDSCSKPHGPNQRIHRDCEVHHWSKMQFNTFNVHHCWRVQLRAFWCV